MPYRVLISYSWRNSAERRAIASEVSQLDGVEVMVDKDTILPGDQIHQRVLDMIDAADCVVVLLTAEGLQSREVLDELSRAHDRHKLIVPVVAKDTGLEALPWYLRDLNWIVYDGRNFDYVVERIISTLKARANPLAGINEAALPPRLKDLIAQGARFIDVPLRGPVKALEQVGDDRFVFCELRMRDTKAVFVFRAPEVMRVGDAAEHLETWPETRLMQV